MTKQCEWIKKIIRKNGEGRRNECGQQGGGGRAGGGAPRGARGGLRGVSPFFSLSPCDKTSSSVILAPLSPSRQPQEDEKHVDPGGREDASPAAFLMAL